jgi:hypothetical protein
MLCALTFSDTGTLLPEFPSLAALQPAPRLHPKPIAVRVRKAVQESIARSGRAWLLRASGLRDMFRTLSAVLSTIGRWLAQASRGRQIANIDHDGPNLFVAENSARCWHSGGPQTVLDDPVELAIGVVLNFPGGQRGHGRGYAICKGNAGVLAI